MSHSDPSVTEALAGLEQSWSAMAAALGLLALVRELERDPEMLARVQAMLEKAREEPDDA